MTGLVMNASAYPIRLGFMPAVHVMADPEHPGLLRAGPRAGGPYGGESVEVHTCGATDMLGAGFQPDLIEHGFDTVDLSGVDELQRACARTRVAGRIAPDDADRIRRSLDGIVLSTSGGRRLRVVHLADEGFIMRTSGPNGMMMVDGPSNGMNGHGAATSVHADQDVYGTPLLQIMGGRAPSMFVHDSPEGQNRAGSLLLLNVWVPLQQITQPLVIADGRSVDRRRHQLRYGLATESFLNRDDADLAINDIWTFLHHPGQRWFFNSEMDHRSAYVFNTLSAPHGAGTLPGEEIAERLYRRLESIERACAAGDREESTRLSRALDGDEAELRTTPALRAAIEAMAVLLRQAIDRPEVLGADWCEASAKARHRLIRMSLELRMVVTLDEP